MRLVESCLPTSLPPPYTLQTQKSCLLNNQRPPLPQGQKKVEGDISRANPVSFRKERKIGLAVEKDTCLPRDFLTYWGEHACEASKMELMS